MPPVTMSPRKATAKTKLVHDLKMGLPLQGTPPDSPQRATKVENVPSRAVTPEPAEKPAEPAVETAPEPEEPEPIHKPEEPTIEPAHELVQIQEPLVQVTERCDSLPESISMPRLRPTESLPALVHRATEPPMPLRVKGKERSNKVGNLVAHFEDASRRKPARPQRTVEQTPISALVSTIRRGFEDMKPLPALEMVEEGDSVSMTPPPRPIGGLKVGGMAELNDPSKLGFGERVALTTMQLNG